MFVENANKHEQHISGADNCLMVFFQYFPDTGDFCSSRFLMQLCGVVWCVVQYGVLWCDVKVGRLTKPLINTKIQNPMPLHNLIRSIPWAETNLFITHKIRIFSVLFNSFQFSCVVYIQNRHTFQLKTHYFDLHKWLI